MTDHPGSSPNGARALRFACSCASAAPVAADPWVAVAKQGKLADGTKELILNALHRRPRTVAQLAALLGLSPPTVHRHIVELLASELIREATVSDDERRSPVERYYRPNFPVVLAGDRRAFELILEELAGAIADNVRARREILAEVFARTSLIAAGETSRTCSTISTPPRPAWHGSGWRRRATCRPGRSTATVRSGCGGRRNRWKRR
jgi:DNA-binding transcriptional ArsR family regulator